MLIKLNKVRQHGAGDVGVWSEDHLGFVVVPLRCGNRAKATGIFPDMVKHHTFASIPMYPCLSAVQGCQIPHGPPMSEIWENAPKPSVEWQCSAPSLSIRMRRYITHSLGLHHFPHQAQIKHLLARCLCAGKEHPGRARVATRARYDVTQPRSGALVRVADKTTRPVLCLNCHQEREYKETTFIFNAENNGLYADLGHASPKPEASVPRPATFVLCICGPSLLIRPPKNELTIQCSISRRRITIASCLTISSK